MKTAEEVAEEIFLEIKTYSGNLIDEQGKPRPQLKYLIAHALTAYATARVEASDDGHAWHKSCRFCRAKALGEAVHIAETFDGGSVKPPHDWISTRNGIAAQLRQHATEVRK